MRITMIGAGMKVIMYVTYLALCLVCGGASLVAHMIKNLPAIQETWVLSLGQENPLEKGMATDSTILSCLENPMDRGAWWTIFHGVTK